MKHKQSMMGFVSGILVSVLLAGAVLPAAAGQSIWVDSGVKVYVNDIPIDAGDTHGNPDAFIYNGTTYVAAAAVSIIGLKRKTAESTTAFHGVSPSAICF